MRCGNMMEQEVIEENSFYADDPQMIVDLLKDQWSLSGGREPVIACRPESYMMNARFGAIYVYSINRNHQISTTDYRTIQRIAHVGIKISSSLRDNHFMICDEVWRILLANRRAGKRVLRGYTFLEVSNERFSNDLLGWYTTTLDVKLTSFNTPMKSPGFGVRKPMPRGCDCTSDF